MQKYLKPTTETATQEPVVQENKNEGFKSKYFSSMVVPVRRMSIIDVPIKSEKPKSDKSSNQKLEKLPKALTKLYKDFQ